MSPKGLPRRHDRTYREDVRLHGQSGAGTGEDPAVRQYRYVLRTAPPDALLALNAAALEGVAASDRQVVLEAAQGQLVAGGRLTTDDVAALARLVSLGERRVPGALLRHIDPLVLGRLARAALDAEAAFGLLTGYAAWDGKDPEPATEEEVDRQFARPGHDAETNHTIARGQGGFSF